MVIGNQFAPEAGDILLYTVVDGPCAIAICSPVLFLFTVPAQHLVELFKCYKYSYLYIQSLVSRSRDIKYSRQRNTMARSKRDAFFSAWNILLMSL